MVQRRLRAGDARDKSQALGVPQREFITSGSAIDIVPEHQLIHELTTPDSDSAAMLLDDLIAIAEQMGYSLGPWAPCRWFLRPTTSTKRS